MGISGSLQDVSVADVMQFIHLGRRTGTLELVRGRERARAGDVDPGVVFQADAERVPPPAVAAAQIPGGGPQRRQRALQRRRGRRLAAPHRRRVEQ